MLSAASARVRVLVMVLVLAVVAAGGWLVQVSSDEAVAATTASAVSGPRPTGHQRPVSLAERRAQTKDRAKATKLHALASARSRPATAKQLALLTKDQQRMKAVGLRTNAATAPRRTAANTLSAAAQTAAAGSYSSGALYQVTADPFGNAAAQQGGFLESLGNHIGAAVPGEPLQLSAAIWQTGGADSEVHPVKVRWKVVDYCTDAADKILDFGQTVQAPTLNTGRTFPVANASVTLPATGCTNPSPSYFVYVCTTVTDDAADTESCGSYNQFYIVPVLPEGAACGSLCGDASGAPGTTVTRADPVNTATGAFSEAFTDAQVPAPGVPFAASRVYSSDNTTTGALGKGWQLPWETRLQIEADGDAVLTGEGGARHTYTNDSGGAFTAPGEVRSTLAVDGSGYRLTTADHTTYGFDAGGRLTGLKDRTGRGLSLAYTGTKPTKITDAAGHAAVLAYVGDRLDTVTLADGRLVDYDYTNDQLSSVKALDGATEHYGYDTAGLLNKVTDARSEDVTKNVYDTQGRVSTQTDALQHTTKFAYTKNGQFDQVDTTAADEGVWTDLYYKSVLFTQIDPLGNKTYFRYDQHFNRTSAIDAEMRETKWDFDTTGRMRSRATGASDEAWTYDANGNVATHQDGEYNTTIFGYNTNNQLTSVKDPLQKTSTYLYDPTSGMLETATSARKKTTVYDVDDTTGQLKSVTTPKGNKTTYAYDDYGRLKTSVDPRGNVSGGDPTKYTTVYTYDDADRLKTVTDAKQHKTVFDYDLAGNLHQVTDAKLRVTLYDYDDNGRLSTVTDPAKKTTVTGYDEVGRIASVTDRTLGKTSYTYDKAGRRLTMVTARGNATGADAKAFTWTFGYDKVGNRKTVTDPRTKTTAFTWDADNPPLSTTDPLNHTRSVTYDDNGSVVKTTDALNHGTTLAYDDDNRLASSKTQYS